MAHEERSVKGNVTARMVTEPTKGRRGRSPAPWVRKEGETDEAFAQRVVTQDRDRLRKNGGVIVVLLQELKEEVAALRLAIGERVPERTSDVLLNDDHLAGLHATLVDRSRPVAPMTSGSTASVRIFQHVTGRLPNAAEEFSLEDGWNAATRLFPQHAAHWFASALAAFFEAHPDGNAMLWVRQMHEQFEIVVRHDWPEWLK